MNTETKRRAREQKLQTKFEGIAGRRRGAVDRKLARFKGSGIRGLSPARQDEIRDAAKPKIDEFRTKRRNKRLAKFK